jgi:hypothetical protein
VMESALEALGSLVATTKCERRKRVGEGLLMGHGEAEGAMEFAVNRVNSRRRYPGHQVPAMLRPNPPKD